MVFWGAFLMAALLAAGREDFAGQVVGEMMVEQMDHMYSEPVNAERKDGMQRSDTFMAGFYIAHNTGIGLRCFASGIIFGLGSLTELLFEGIVLGTVFGHMATTAHAANFYTFVTAHSSFELTAIVLSGAAGLRLGWGLVDTQGQSRSSSLSAARRQFAPGRGSGGRALCSGRGGGRVCLGVGITLFGQGRRGHFQRCGHHRLPVAGRTRRKRRRGPWTCCGHCRDRIRSGVMTDEVKTTTTADCGPFRYRPGCSAPACDQPALYKIAAAWSDGTSRELKNYGLACQDHSESQLDAARNRVRSLKLGDAESVGPVELYVLRTGCRDVDLRCVGDDAAGRPNEKDRG